MQRRVLFIGGFAVFQSMCLLLLPLGVPQMDLNDQIRDDTKCSLAGVAHSLSWQTATASSQKCATGVSLSVAVTVYKCQVSSLNWLLSSTQVVESQAVLLGGYES